MTLRTRLVLALVGLTTIGLSVFGASTYTLYRRSLQQQLDQDLSANARGQGGRLVVSAALYTYDTTTCTPTGTTALGDEALNGSGSIPGGAGTLFNIPGTGPGSAPGQALDAYAEIRQASGDVRACILPVTVTGRPRLPASLDLGTDGERFLTTGSTTGSGDWRVLAISADQVPAPRNQLGNGAEVQAAIDSDVVIVAVRTSGLDNSLGRLIRIELGAAVCLLTVLGLGAWLVLRRGLRPLEEMAGSAATITAGDLSQRVEPADDHTEVGQLGLALNTMLDGIEDSFRERDATERRLRQFLADASHELRTPLTSIQGFAELFRLADTGRPGDLDRIDLPVVLSRIEQESGRMRILVEDLLLLARLDEPRAIEPSPVDLAVLAAEACASAATLQPDRSITLDAPEPVVVEGVADHLHRAVVNLVTNAIKHTPEDSPIEVVVAADAATELATVTVRDHGRGLEPDALAHAFDRFWQADSARVGTGSGLGLSIVEGIAAEHGGRASATNAPGGGAAFTIELPLGSSRPSGPSERSDPTGTAGSTG